jgi:hypothetical protein
VKRNRLLVIGLVLVLAGVAVGQIIPGGNRPPRNNTVIVGGGDIFVTGKIPVVRQNGQQSSLDGLHRIFKGTGQVETFVIIVNADGTKTGRWVPAVDLAQ